MVDSDVQMSDAPSGAAGSGEFSTDDGNKVKVRVLPGGTPTAASFEVENEDHTLGNALRYVIMKNPAVEFCGYTIPHPSEAKMNIRIQTYDDSTAHAALEKGLNDLIDLCNVVEDKFVTVRNDFRENA